MAIIFKQMRMPTVLLLAMLIGAPLAAEARDLVPSPAVGTSVTVPLTRAERRIDANGAIMVRTWFRSPDDHEHVYSAILERTAAQAKALGQVPGIETRTAVPPAAASATVTVIRAARHTGILGAIWETTYFRAPLPDGRERALAVLVVTPAPKKPGGGGGDPQVSITPAQAARFLHQATYGATDADIAAVQKLGYRGWLEQQFATPSIDSHWAYVAVRHGPPNCTTCDAKYINAVMESFWRQAILGPDQLRQRLVFALTEHFVVSTVNSSVDIQEQAHASYLDMLAANAFGNFRDLLLAVSTHPTMGHYLTFFQNTKANPVTGQIPDENYAREVMQLFTIGLWQLNPDGTRKRDSAGNPIPTYAQDDVRGLAKVFTGWSWNGPDKTDGCFYWCPQNWHDPMQAFPKFAATDAKVFLGQTIPAGTDPVRSLNAAVDTLFNHPNVGPFLATRLIKRFVTSNPSPAYVGRVAAAFANDGNGVRGDMKAVMRAVLLDPEARDDKKLSDPQWGKLREPMIRFANFMRGFAVHSSSSYYRIWNLEDPAYALDQNALRAPSVFNFFRPDYAPPGPILDRGLSAPEFQITDETTTTGYANFLYWIPQRWTTQWARENGYTDQSAPDYLLTDYGQELPLAGNATALVDRINLLLCAGEMTDATRGLIVQAVNAVPLSDHDGALNRVATAVYLTMNSPDYLVQK